MPREVRIPGPDHPIEISRNPGRVRVTTGNGDKVVAETTSAVTLSEAGYPPVHYIPLADVDQALLVRTASHTYCPCKGEASYYGLVTAERTWVRSPAPRRARAGRVSGGPPTSCRVR